LPELPPLVESVWPVAYCPSVTRQQSPATSAKPTSVEPALRQAARLIEQGRPSEAAALYQDVLGRYPGNKRAMEGLQGLAKSQSDIVPDAQVKAIVAAYNAGRFAQAVDAAARLAGLFPEAFVLHNVIGAGNARLGRFEAALTGFDRALQLRQDHVAVLHERGNVLKSMGRLDEALASYDRALREKPDLVPTHSSRGLVLGALGRFGEALAAFDRALQYKPDHAEAWNNRGIVLTELKRAAEAIESFDRALQARSDYPEAHNNRGNALAALGRGEEALNAYEQALKLRPDFADAYTNLGSTLLGLGRAKEALNAHEAALKCDSRPAKLHNNRGTALAALKRLDEAVAAFGEALRRDPQNADARFNRGSALGALKRHNEALADFREAASLKPAFHQAVSQARHLQAQMCAWEDMVDIPAPNEPNGYGRGFTPFMMATMLDDPARQQACARAWIEQNNPSVPTRPFSPRERPERLRIGYFSADFEDHATMVLMAGLLERHDRSRFEVHAYSYGKPCEDHARRRTVAAVEHFHDVAGVSDAAIVDLARRHHLDIAIDLKGFTHDSRYNLFLHRLAPVQVSYLGYPGTMGAPFIDYIVADKVVLPPEAAPFYDEKVIWLPGSYQANDNTRAISDRKYNRAELGLPESGFVFCCFNNSYKLTPAEFDIWMRLLGAVEGSVLWLLKCSVQAETNLRREAAARDIAPERLVFAPRLPLADHLARHAHADLFLDTFACNAHTTASDALWAGLPVLTRSGRSFAARVATSLVHAVGLPEMAVETDEAYERLALELAAKPERLAAIRAKLAANRLTAPLFDTERTTRNLERAYELAYERHLAGLAPDHIEVADSPAE
jgi:protein O-GlcNAc transferase